MPSVFVALLFISAALATSQIYAGVAKVDATLPVGAPLAGYNYEPRRAKSYPFPTFTRYTTLMNPSEGVSMPLWAKCIVLADNNTKVAFIAMDAIGADGTLFREAYNFSRAQGFSVPFENVILSGSHTHSGPGGLTSELLWELAPATDILKTELRTELASYLAGCLVEAELRLQPAKVGIGKGVVTNASHNRRASYSPYVKHDSVDTQLGIIRIDDMQGKRLGTLWNFAIHGTCYDADNMKMHGDIMGVANQLIEHDTNAPALFINSDAGDIAPSGCHEWEGSKILAKAVEETSASLVTSPQLDIAVASKIVDFGKTNLNLTLQRLENCTKGGPLDICLFCQQKFLNCHLDIHLGSNWIETTPKFTGVRLTQNGKHTLLVTAPGEPIFALGTQIKNDGKSLGFDDVFVFGYSNNHMAYFTTPEEYIVGGYESQLTLWGIGTSEKVRQGAYTVAQQVKP